MLRTNRRPVLTVGGTQVPRSELAYYRVGCDGVLMAARLSRAALRLLPELAARACRQLVPLRNVAEEFVCRGCATWHGLRLGQRRRVLVQTGWLLCEVETSRVRRRLVV
jgi:hypothetical protein